MPRCFWCTCVLAVVWCTCLPAPGVFAQWIDWPLPASWQADTELTDVCFVDSQRGWITGDRGLLLRTTDGGQTWERVPLDVTCRLECVWFASPGHGWIAGGYQHPRATTSSGVLFRTTDGGNSWDQVQGITLPRIHRLHFSTPQQGLAAGCGNAQQPAGIFETVDGGRSWSSQSRGDIQAWQTASFLGNRVALASHQGDMAVYEAGETKPAYIVNTSPSIIRDLVMIDERYGFAVGDHGSVLQTKNGGLSWQPTELSQGLPGAPVDYQTICYRGDNLWIAGSPGNRIWKMNARERVWQAADTPVRLPIQRIHFVDDQHGWAISCGGDVIHSDDGGISWTMQRRGSAGVALLQVVQDPVELVPELFAVYCAEQNYIGGTLLVSRGGDPPPLDAMRLALARVGGSFVQPVMINEEDPATAAARMRETLVRQIRTLRPRVVLIPAATEIDDPLNFRATLLAAVQAAADINQYEEQIAALGLEPWQTGKIVTIDYGNGGTQKISPGQYMTSMGALIGDYCLPSRLLSGQHHKSRTVSLNTIFTSPWAAGSDNSLFASIEQMDAEVPRRRGQKNAAGNLAQMRKLAGKRKVFERFMELAPQQARSAAIWNANLADLVAQLDQPTAAIWLFELAARCQREGYNYLAVQTHLYLSDNFRQHPLAVASLHWLYNEYSSGERAHVAVQQLRQLAQATPIESAIPDGITSRPVTKIVDGVPMTTWELVEDTLKGSNVENVAWTSAQTAAASLRRYQQALSFSQTLGLVDPTALDLGRRPFSRISLNRKLQTRVSADTQLKDMMLSPATDDVSQDALIRVASMELDLLESRQARANSHLLKCYQSASRPWLDGNLEDEAWTAAAEGASQLHLHQSVGSGQPDTLWITCDEQFLYLALRCRRLSGTRLPDAIGRRPRDSNLLDSDRVEISIDIDRDYCSAFLFVVDSSGRVAESIGDDLAWNPAWYVATAAQGEFWTAEVAIPLQELGDQSQHEVWAVSANRHLRGQLVSTCWQISESSPQPPSQMASRHAAAMRQQSAITHIPLAAIHWVEMPWQGHTDDSKSSETSDLPDQR